MQASTFANSTLARVVALVIALLLAFVLWSNWSKDFQNLFAGSSDAPKTVSTAEPAKPANPALQKCLDQRVGDVERMKSEGVLSDSQFDAFKARAQSLCRAQNPA